MIFEIVGTEIVVIGDEVRYLPVVTEVETLWELGENGGVLAAIESDDDENNQEFDD